MPEARSVDIGGVELEYLEYPGGEPCTVMLHATGFQPWLWHPIARELSPTHRVIAPYFCDHRTFDPATGGLSWLMLAGDIAAFARVLGLETPVLVGHSMGATVAAIAEALHGPIASRMILIEPIFLPEQVYDLDITVEQHPLASKAIRRRSEWEDREQAVEYLRSKELFSGWDDEMLALYLEHGMTRAGEGGLTLVCQPVREAALFMGGMARDPWPLLEDITCPVLFVEGENSENRGVIDLARAASIVPEANLRVVEGAGHLVPMEKPREVLSIINDFATRT